MTNEQEQNERDRQYDVARQQRVAFREERKSHMGAILLAVVIFFLLGIGAVVLVVRTANPDSMTARLVSSILGRPIGFDTSAPVVIQQIQKLNRLETVSYSVDTVVEGKRSNAVLPDLLFGDRLLLVVHGQVIAGVDLSALKEGSVKVTGKSVTVDLPSSQLFTTRIDEAKSRVFARSTGLLVPMDPNLETETRRTAETQIQQAAMQDGILDTARSNARMSVESLLRGLGFEAVTVR